MHAVFMAYGMKDKVEYFLKELEHQKLVITFYKDEEKVTFPVQCQVRILPFGIYEFVFPKEHMDAVLTTLRFHQKPPYNLDKSLLGIKPFKVIKDFLRIEEIPEFKTDNIIPLYFEHVAIVPIGVRYDGEITEKQGKYEGWHHEAI